VACLLAGGHLLIEDVPGVGKTTLAHALARTFGLQFSRVQFTSDLLPSDVTGVAIYDETIKEFVFKKGPVFANVVLADEINRATPKTQSALLEVMDRARVTVDGEAHAVGAPFMVFATQNPVDYEGTFPLPESQMGSGRLDWQVGQPWAPALQPRAQRQLPLPLPCPAPGSALARAPCCATAPPCLACSWMLLQCRR
jgi:MoxR-like ATPase